MTAEYTICAMRSTGVILQAAIAAEHGLVVIAARPGILQATIAAEHIYLLDLHGCGNL